MPPSSEALISTESQREIHHADQFKEALTHASDAAIGVILVRTREPYRAQEVIQEWSVRQDKIFKVWTVLTGWQSFPIPDERMSGDTDYTKPIGQDEAYDPVKAFDKLLETEHPDKFCGVFMNAQYAMESPGLQQHIKLQVQRSLEGDQRIIFLVPESAEIPTTLRDDFHIIDFKTPSHAEMVIVWERLLEHIKEESHPGFNDTQVGEIVQNGLGMSAHEFETSIAQAFVRLRADDNDAELTPQDFIHYVLKTKVAVSNFGDLLELMDPVDIDDIGGLDVLKEWIDKRKQAYSDEARAFGIDQPKGTLIVGPPGGGKSLIAKAISGVFGVPCLKFDIGKVFGSLVGQSEGRMRQALSMIESMAPCVLFLDEIDKGFGGVGGSSSDGGTTQRVFGTFLTWMQERGNKGLPVFAVMTANNVQGMPPELMRKGRIDEVWAVTFPSPEERALILNIHMRKRGHEDALTPEDIADVIKHTNGFVGSEIEGVVMEALVEAFSAGETVLTAERLIEEADKIVPLSKAFAHAVAEMNEWAKNNARAASSTMTFDNPTDNPPDDSKVIRRGRRGKNPRKRIRRGSSEN